ncbi:MAG: hypothetical protein E7559_09540 [Ruminococcaceae bacterium]|nr:hypothetical protein [Oscillospiraceae bacterium]
MNYYASDCIRSDQCGRRLCRSCRPVLKRFSIARSAGLKEGAPEHSRFVSTGRVCGFAERRIAEGRLSTLGHSGQEQYVMTVVASGFGNVRRGDRITVDGAVWRVSSAGGKCPVTVTLLPELEEDIQWS